MGEGFLCSERRKTAECRPCLRLLRDIIERNFHVVITVRLASKRDDRGSLSAYAEKNSRGYDGGRSAERRGFSRFEDALFSALPLLG